MPWGDCVKDADKVAGGVATLACVPKVFQNIVSGALIFAGIIALFFVIFAGVKMMLSGGEAKQYESAQKTLTYAIAGLAIILFSFLILNIFSTVTGVTCIQLFGFSNCQ